MLSKLCTRVARRDSCAERLEGFRDGHSLRHSLLGLVIHTNQLGHEFKYLVKQFARNHHNPFQWIAEDNISLEHSENLVRQKATQKID